MIWQSAVCNAQNLQILVFDTRLGSCNRPDAQLLVFDTRLGNYNADTPWIHPCRLLSSIPAGQVLLT